MMDTNSPPAGTVVRYEAMCRAIALCEAVDEVKDIRDKAAALKVYWHQSRNLEAERQACNIRVRAERRTGELLKELGRATPSDAGIASGMARNATQAGSRSASPYAQTLERNGIPRTTAQRFEALADVPAAVFEAALANDEAMPSASAIVQSVRDPAPELDRDALWIWGTLRDFERMNILDREPIDLLNGMTPTMRADVIRLAPTISAFVAVLAHGENYEPT